MIGANTDIRQKKESNIVGLLAPPCSRNPDISPARNKDLFGTGRKAWGRYNFISSFSSSTCRHMRPLLLLQILCRCFLMFMIKILPPVARQPIQVNLQIPQKMVINNISLIVPAMRLAFWRNTSAMSCNIKEHFNANSSAN